MASMEEQLISRIVRDGLPAYQKALEWGIGYEDFKATAPSSIWRTFDDYYRSLETKGSIPGPTTIGLQFPTFSLIDDMSMTLEALCREVRKERLRKQLKEHLLEASTSADYDPVLALGKLQASLGPLMDLGVTRKTDVVFREEFDGIIDDYEAIERGEYRSAAPWPWQSLQNATGGIAEDDFIVLYGRPKSMKTWVLCFLIACLLEGGKSVLLYTKEMTPRNIFKRIAACLAKIPYQEFRTGKLSYAHKQQLKDIYNFLVDSYSGNLIALSAKDVSTGGDTVAWLRTKAEKYKPALICIDGMYLMSDGKNGKSSDWGRVTNISREVSAMRLDLQTPVVATLQANRKAAGHSNAELDEIAYADAVGQDATVAIRVVNEKSKPTIALVVGGSREFQLHGVRIGGIPATDFEEKEIMSEKEILKAKEDDAKKEEEDDPSTLSKPRRTPRTGSNGAANGHSVDALLKEQLSSL